MQIPSTCASRKPHATIPVNAVQNVGGVAVAFVRAAGNRFEKRVLRLGQRSADWVEVIDGVSAGDTVVTEGSFLLKSEAKKSELGEHED